MATITATHHEELWKARPVRGDELGSDHPDRGQPRHLYQDRFRQAPSGRVSQHFIDLPRLQHLHEGQRSARCALHHQPHLRHLRRQPRHLRDLRAEHGIRRAAAARWPSGSSILAKPPNTCSTTTSSRTTWSGVDFCEQMVKETNPGVWEKAQKDGCAARRICTAIKTIADIMKALNPFTGAFYLEALQMSRMTREMFCLMEGRHVHPSTLYPGGVGTVPTVQLFTDYIVRLMKYVEFMKKVVPLHDDLFDFFYEALPGYEEVGRRRILLGCWGSFNNPEVCDYTYEKMTRVGPRDVCHAGRGCGWQAGDHRSGRHQPEHPHPAGQFVLRRLGERRRPSSSRIRWAIRSISGIRGTRPPYPKPQKRDFNGKYTWVMSPRWYDKRTGDYLALDTGGGPIARFWATALAGIVDIGYIKATGHSVKIYLPEDCSLPEVEFEWKIPKWSNAIERDRARTYFQAYAAAAALSLRRTGAGRAARRPHAAPGTTSRFPKRRLDADSTKRCAASCRITW